MLSFLSIVVGTPLGLLLPPHALLLLCCLGMPMQLATGAWLKALRLQGFAGADVAGCTRSAHQWRGWRELPLYVPAERISKVMPCKKGQISCLMTALVTQLKFPVMLQRQSCSIGISSTMVPDMHVKADVKFAK